MRPLASSITTDLEEPTLAPRLLSERQYAVSLDYARLAIAGGNGIASFALAVPPDPVLAGTISTLQAVASHATLSPGWRLSTAARVHLY